MTIACHIEIVPWGEGRISTADKIIFHLCRSFMYPSLLIERIGDLARHSRPENPVSDSTFVHVERRGEVKLPVFLSFQFQAILTRVRISKS